MRWQDGLGSHSARAPSWAALGRAASPASVRARVNTESSVSMSRLTLRSMNDDCISVRRSAASSAAMKCCSYCLRAAGW